MGEGAAPTISFNRDVVLGGAPLSAGTYALVAIPSAGDWTIVVSRQTRIWRADARDPRLDVARVKAQVEVAPPRERLTFLFADFTDDQAILNLEWDKIRVRMSIALHTEEQVRAQLQALDGAWRSYADIAVYWLEKGKDLDTGLVYVNRSLVLRETWYNVWLKASLLAAKGDYPGARVAAERAYQLGRAAGEGFTLEPTVREALAAWPTVPVDTVIAGDDQGGEPFPASLERPAEPRRNPGRQAAQRVRVLTDHQARSTGSSALLSTRAAAGSGAQHREGHRLDRCRHFRSRDKGRPRAVAGPGGVRFVHSGRRSPMDVSSFSRRVRDPGAVGAERAPLGEALDGDRLTRQLVSRPGERPTPAMVGNRMATAAAFSGRWVGS